MSNHEQLAFATPQRTPDLDMVSFVAALPSHHEDQDAESNNELIRVLNTFPFHWG